VLVLARPVDLIFIFGRNFLLLRECTSIGIHDNAAMMTSKLNRWWRRGATFAIAALAAGSATFWGLKFSAPVPSVQTIAVVASGLEAPDAQAWVRLLGGQKADALPAADLVAPDVSSNRFKLMGVIAGRSNQGYALIAIDGKPAKPFRVGAQVDEALMLHSVAPRSARLAPRPDAPAQLTLVLPKLTTP
jgi:general secretion pathway protein C